ncbi:MAG: D-alanyl-D-alanine carboxypeptidase family protein [Bacilli bacterium]|nr:D-alanyl-D-alanine carboxypeptidase family protein [Bacilli bacterium]
MPKRKRIKKRRIKKTIIILIILFVLCFCGYLFYKHKYDYTFKFKKEVIVNIDEKVDSKDYVLEVKNVTVKYPDVDTSTPGVKKIIYTVTDRSKKKHTYTLKLEVKDNIAPNIDAKDSVDVYVGDKVDLNSYIKVSDNVDSNLDVSYDKELDTSKEGNYTITFTVKDKSNNKSIHKITFNVKKKPIADITDLPDGIVGKTSKGYTIENKGGATYVDNILIANKTYVLSSKYGNGLTNETQYAFNEMKKDALAAGFDIRIGSGFRSYSSQKTIYNNYVKRDGQAKADTYSARAGHSEHQTGLAIDICASGYNCITSSFNGTPPANWLSENAYKYGFILRYPEGKTNETGYKFESWHFRYVGKDLASKVYNGGDWITLEAFYGITSEYN